MEENNGIINSERNWYLYVVDEHEGPFSITEIQNKVDAGEARLTSYVWKEGMPDWVLMSALPHFAKKTKKESTAQTSSKSMEALGFSKQKITQKLPDKGANTQEIKAKLKDMLSGMSATSKRRNIPYFKILFFLLGLYQLLALNKLDFVLDKIKIKEKVTALKLKPIPMPSEEFMKGIQQKINPPINQIKKLVITYIPAQYKKYFISIELPKEVPEKDSEALIQAASESIQSGARIASSFIPTSTSNPKFIIAGNLPDNTQVDITIRGKFKTLLNAVSYEAKSTAVFKNKLAESAPFKLSSAIPKGEYSVLIYESEHQSPETSLALAAYPRRPIPALIPEGKTAFFVDSVFLGGTLDENYTNALKIFNEKMTKQLDFEINEIKQFHSTIESLANESATRFFKISKNVVPKFQKNNWKQYSSQYQKMSSQLSAQILRSNTKQVLDSKFLPQLYRSSLEAYQLTQSLHELESIYFDKKSTMQDIQQKAVVTLTAINNLKSDLTKLIPN